MREGLRARQSRWGRTQEAGRALDVGQQLWEGRVWPGMDAQGAVLSEGTHSVARRVVCCPLHSFTHKPFLAYRRACRA